jgi:hypothetical protein
MGAMGRHLVCLNHTAKTDTNPLFVRLPGYIPSHSFLFSLSVQPIILPLLPTPVAIANSTKFSDFPQNHLTECTNPSISLHQGCFFDATTQPKNLALSRIVTSNSEQLTAANCQPSPAANGSLSLR